MVDTCSLRGNLYKVNMEAALIDFQKSLTDAVSYADPKALVLLCLYACLRLVTKKVLKPEKAVFLEGGHEYQRSYLFHYKFPLLNRMRYFAVRDFATT